MLKAYKTACRRRSLRVELVSDFLDARALEEHRIELDCVSLSPEMYISLFRSSRYPLVNIDEYFNYAELMGINLATDSKAREESFAILLEILETKYGIEYVEAEK
jgi:hypothetical protein